MPWRPVHIVVLKDVEPADVAAQASYLAGGDDLVPQARHVRDGNVQRGQLLGEDDRARSVAGEVAGATMPAFHQRSAEVVGGDEEGGLPFGFGA